jgi:hypothetical protein
MEATSLLQSFAIAKDGRVVSVDEVERGQACGCTCPACRRPLIARQGEVRVWHFAHATGADCEGGAESALHLAAKTAIERAGGITLPGLSVKRTLTLPDGRRGTGEASIPETWIDFSEVRTEVHLGAVIPDVVGTAGMQSYLIEVGVTHFVDTDKRAILKGLGNPSIEIDLHSLDREAWDWPALEEIVVHGVSGKHWLAYPGHEALVAQATERARAAAQALPLPMLPPEAPQNAKPTRTRYWPDGRIVDLVDFPFGVVLWSPYDAQFNEVVKAWCRRFGGRWQQSHKNWLFPLQVKPLLVAEIGKRQTRPPGVKA